MISNALILIRFNQSEMKRLYRIFKSECPSGLITEEVFHNIFSKFFPLGAESYSGKQATVFIDCERINIPYGQSSAKLPVIQSFGHSVIRSLGHSVTWSVILSSFFQHMPHTNGQHQGLQVCFADKYE